MENKVKLLEDNLDRSEDALSKTSLQLSTAETVSITKQTCKPFIGKLYLQERIYRTIIVTRSMIGFVQILSWRYCSIFAYNLFGKQDVPDFDTQSLIR